MSKRSSKCKPCKGTGAQKAVFRSALSIYHSETLISVCPCCQGRGTK